MDEVDAIYKGEVQFLNWSDGGNTGPKIVLALPDRKYLDNFVNSKGKRYAIMMVEILDDESMPTKRERLGPLCEWAVMRCKEPMFWEFLSTFDIEPVTNEQESKDTLVFLCTVDSRKEFDSDPGAGARLKRLIMEPYKAWYEQQCRDVMV